MGREGMLFVTNLHFNRNGNGGQQRTYFLIKELSRHFDLVVISPYISHDIEVQDITANFILNRGIKTQKFFRSSIFKKVIGKILNFIFKIFARPTNPFISHISSYQLSRQIKSFRQQGRNSSLDIVVFDTLSTVVPLSPAHFQKRILNAHNFESELHHFLLKQQLQDNSASKLQLENSRRTLKKFTKYEFDLDTYFEEIWTCSDSDSLKFKTNNPNTGVDFKVIPNGSDTEHRNFQKINNNYKKLLFVGSLNYFPNINGLRWFVEEIFSKLSKDYELTIVGKSPNINSFDFVKPFSNIQLIGQVESVTPYYETHDVFIVPLHEGSGTRLKILEAFSYGKLVLSTRKGIEGISASDGKHYIGFDNYSDFIQKFIENGNLTSFEEMRKEARKLVEISYSWQYIVSQYSKNNIDGK